MANDWLREAVDKLHQAAVDKAAEFWFAGRAATEMIEPGGLHGASSSRPQAPPQPSLNGPPVVLPTLDEVRKMVEPEFADIPTMFQPYLDMPVPEAFAPLIDYLDSAVGALSPGVSLSGDANKTPLGGVVYPANPDISIDRVKRALAPWTGAAADAFETNVLDHYQPIEYNQVLLLLALRGGLSAEQAIWAAVQHDIGQIADSTRATIEAMRPPDDDQLVWTITFTLLAAVLAVIPVVGEGAMAVGFTIAAGAATTAAALPVTGGSSCQFQAATPWQAVDQLYQAIQQLAGYIHDQETAIARCLNQARMACEAHPGEYRFPRQTLDDATAGGVTSDRYLGSCY